ncbi:uncharacterized protein LOC128159408 [Crassostrea angulata]|uniref:uncharacterized protein LOC128159408 n=1 Tax=Magallana angulata TaxID=2784310 RepID=UPI0022B168D0|nr:uncharacterized protein LOC128159408 [Crassostrea angulata]
MFYALGALLLANLASAQVFQIEIANTTVEYGSTDISISCVVTNGSTLGTVFAISLKKSDASAVSITTSSNEGISWQDTSLKNRNGVTANGSLSDVSKAHLHLYIPSSSVVYPEDEGTYQCTMSGLDLMNTPVTEDSESVFLNITGYIDTTKAPDLSTITVPSSTNPGCELSRGSILLIILTILGCTVMRRFGVKR